jgi:hypothetical protein
VKRDLSTSVMLGVGATVLACVLTGCAQMSPSASLGGDGPDTPGLTGHGTGIVTGTPDTLRIVLGVQTRGLNATGALNDNNRQAAAVINSLKSHGVPDADLQTSQLSISPSYGPDGSQVTGYDVSNIVTATLHNMASAGSIIDAAGQAAGNAIRVQSVDFSIDNDSELLAKARTDAVKQAQAQARQLADAAGIKLGKLRSINESSGGTPPVPMYNRSLGAAASDVPIQAGSQKLSVTVDVTYDLDQ